MRFVLPAIGLLAISACAPAVPDSAAGVGFGDYDSYQQQRYARDVELSGGTNVIPPQYAPDGTPVVTNITPVATAPLPQQQQTAPLPQQQQPVATATNNVGISDEQDFSAVSSRETIQSDRQRLEQQRAQYEFIEPTAVPTRTGSTGPNVVDYALSTTNVVGQKVYRRSGLVSAASMARNCAKYPSSDQAQIAFLEAGGPERDRKGLDPDGDGFACYWDPAPFRLAVNG
ncbi:hypothetical protein [Actibacterium lipolyticum]|uniref:Excalibur calcium-binding domain-containing protein n=1 Tax=Actibacterium lipolyticum TaxID=1524263 RepID=A0A238JPE0_9RHOB|nr:hypothetical protein [Actibacterium lipolyticum]SMX32539.1 hypothetical protein COL8621_00839 [Actibacterium lipolyticum]